MRMLFGFTFGISAVSAYLEARDGGYDRDVVRYALIAAASFIGLVVA